MHDVASLKSILGLHPCRHGGRLTSFLDELFSHYSDSTFYEFEASQEESVDEGSEAFQICVYFDDNVNKTQLYVELDLYSIELEANS